MKNPRYLKDPGYVVLLIAIVIVSMLSTNACTPKTYVTVSDVLAKGKPGDSVKFYSAQVVDISYSPIMQQTGFYLKTHESNDLITAVAANAVIDNGLERIKAEEKGLMLNISGQVANHDVLGPLIFIHELEVIN
ncbi:hypothetical protein [Desulfitibacter alkalitolerans]|uniref:hypothetical protein n=1 Tax=Desulfitibacter alkalitolerans TaxID=264641 RepID=UPI000481A02E|nr:hypothetical protein [Desulfitibacter alkalitolerans]